MQIDTLRQADVDLVSAMTFNNVPEAVGVARAAANAGLPLALSFVVDPTGRLRTGPSLKEAVEAVDEQAGDARPDFYGINCSHPVEFEPALVAGPWLERIRSLRPNASMADKLSLCRIGHLEAGDPEMLGTQMGALARRLAHIDVWGGCCGTWYGHLARHRPAAASAPHRCLTVDRARVSCRPAPPARRARRRADGRPAVRTITPPSTPRPRRRWASVIATRVAASPARSSRTSTDDAVEDPLERRVDELLLPAAHRRRRGLDDVEVGAHRHALGGRQHLREGLPLDALHARHARPPARQVVGVADDRPQLLGRRAQRSRAAHGRHRTPYSES